MGLLDKYIIDEYSICREERQYALYFHNYLKTLIDKTSQEVSEEINELKKEMFGDKNVIVKKVFYEATFMRDIYEYDKRVAYANAELNKIKESELSEDKVNEVINKKIIQISSPTYHEKCYDGVFGENVRFNQKLLNFVKKNYSQVESEVEKLVERITDIVDYNLGAIGGQKKIKEILGENNGEKLKAILRGMMNSKPDIAVIYQNGDNKNKVKFLECKFLSEIDKDNIGNTQLDYQNNIGEFLKDIGVVDDNIETKVVRFIREVVEEESDKKIDNSEKINDGEYKISITRLIIRENELFGI